MIHRPPQFHGFPAKRLQITLVLLTLLLSILACNLPASSTVSSNNIIWVTADPNATPTPTPFQPLAPTFTPTSMPPTATPVEPTPENTPEPEQPTVDPALSSGIINILVLGSDQRQSADFRTDVIVLVSLNPATGRVALISFPRDLYVEIPYWGYDRINTAMEYGGFVMMANTFETNFGVRPSHYVLTNFQSFVTIINSLDGIDINASQALTDKCKLPEAVGGYCTFGPGPVHLTGEAALWYVRSRYSTSDFDRTRRAQEVLLGLFKSLVSINGLMRVPELYEIYRQNVETNLSLADVLPLASMAPGLVANPEKIRQYAVGPAEVYSYTTEAGAQVLMPNYNAVYYLVQQAVYGE